MNNVIDFGSHNKSKHKKQPGDMTPYQCQCGNYELCVLDTGKVICPACLQIMPDLKVYKE